MTKLDELIEEIQSDSNAKEAMHRLLDKLVEEREAMQDPADADAADQVLARVLKDYLKGSLWERSGDISDENADPEYMEKTAAAVEEAFASQGWSNFSKRSRRNDLMQYELGFNIENTSIRVSVIVEDLPKRISVHATLPFVGEKTYEYLLSKAIVDANERLRFLYGAFSYDRNDGEITYDYSYPITHGFFQDDFLRIVHDVILTAVDDEAFSSIKKAAQGRYKRTKREEILKSLAPLVEDLAD